MHMRQFSRRTWVAVAALAALAIIAVLAIVPHEVRAVLVAFVLGGGGGKSILTASVFVPVIAKNRDTLNAMANPQGADMQAFRAPLYDTQLFTSAATVQLSYFGVINADKSMSNVKGNGGIFPNNMYFEPLWMNFDVLANPTLGANTALGILNDIQQLVMTGRGFAKITIGSVTYPEIPLSYLHTSGGAIGVISGTWTAPQQVQVGNNGQQDSGYCIAGGFLISPMLPFSVVVTWPAALTLASGNINLRCSLDGNWHLPVS